MSWRNKVVWSEGVFLHPQHFQQHDRYMENYVDTRCKSLQALGWGLTSLEIDHELLKLGKIAISTARGVLPDGTPFDIPTDYPPPAPLEIPEDCHSQQIYLALPLARQGMADTVIGEDNEPLTRYRTHNIQINDNNSGHSKTVPLQVGQLQMHLMLESEQRDHFSCLSLARVLESRPDQGVILDNTHIPTCLDCSASVKIKSYITELLGLLAHRSEALAERVSGTARGGIADFADFLMLQVVNRAGPLIEHLHSLPGLHPESFYRCALQIAAELATFTSDERRPPKFQPYRHDDSEESFASLMNELRRSLTMVLEQKAIAVELEERKYGVHLATLADRSLLQEAQFILAVKASVRQEALQQQVPSQIKIGPADYIRQMVNSGLPGIGLRLLPVPPRHIPYHAGFTYFELDKTNQYWSGLDSSGAIALHVSGNFPELELELWAIKA